MPRSYINNTNRIFREEYIYYRAGSIGDKYMIHMLISLRYSDVILQGLAYSGHFKLLKTYMPLYNNIHLNDIGWSHNYKDLIIQEAAACGGQLKILIWLIPKTRDKYCL